MKGFMQNMWKNRAHVIMALPAFLVLFFIMYVPMAGLVMAFKAFDYSKGIFGSPWNGIENFKFLLASKSTFINMTKNTVLYYLLFTSVGTVLNVALAIAIDNLILKRMAKTMQTLMIIPVFISYAAVQFIVYAFISSDTGLINNALGLNIKFYSVAKLWPWILLITKIWKDTGYGSVLYMSVLSGIDTSLYEAADIDGANKWQKICHITIRDALRYRPVLPGHPQQRHTVLHHPGYRLLRAEPDLQEFQLRVHRGHLLLPVGRGPAADAVRELHRSQDRA